MIHRPVRMYSPQGPSRKLSLSPFVDLKPPDETQIHYSRLHFDGSFSTGCAPNSLLALMVLGSAARHPHANRFVRRLQAGR